jgi:hypothetical protein
MSAENLLLHPKTHQALTTYLERPASALAIIGPGGSGKKYISDYLVTELGKSSPAKMLDRGELIMISEDDQFGIDYIRQLIKNLSVKPNKERINFRIVVIHDAEQLGQEAQNALLKTLEQPPTPTYFIFTVSSPRGLLPTIMSRVSQIQIKPVGLDMACNFYKNDYSNKDIEQAWQISAGRVGFMAALLDGKSGVRASIELAKQFLGSSPYQRLILLNNISGSREEFADFLDALTIVLRALQHSQIEKEYNTSAAKITAARKLAMDVRTKIGQSASVKLAALKLITDVGI